MLDSDTILTLRELGERDDSIMLLELFEIFNTQTPELISRIIAAHEASDMIALEQAAHTLKGSCLNLGCYAMARTCIQLERAGRERMTQGIAEHIDVLRIQFEQTVPLLREALSRNSEKI